MEGSRILIFFGTAIYVIKDGASLNKFFFSSNTDLKQTYAHVLLLHFDLIHHRSVSGSAFFGDHFHIVLIGEESGTEFSHRKWPMISKMFRDDFTIKFKLQYFHIVSSCFNVSKFKNNISVLCYFIFPEKKKMGLMVWISLHYW